MAMIYKILLTVFRYKCVSIIPGISSRDSRMRDKNPRPVRGFCLAHYSRGRGVLINFIDS